MTLGEALTPEFVSKAVRKPVSSINVIKRQELEQSEVAQVAVCLADGCETQLLFKRYDLRALMARVPKPPEKWRVSALSFENEFHFLEHVAGMNEEIRAWMAPAGGLPETLYANGEVSPSDWFDRRYDFAVSYLAPEAYLQAHQLDAAQAEAAMRWLARFHALWWQPRSADAAATSSITGEGVVSTAGAGTAGSSGTSDWRCGLFKRGAWWRKPLRPSVDYAALPATFAGLCASFPQRELFGWLDTPDAHDAMQQLADGVDELTAVVEACADTTIVHGDFKTSNIFFSRQPAAAAGSSGGGSGEGVPLVQAIDWQWTGLAPSGLADVVYCLYGGVRYDALAGGGEARLLRAYHAALSDALAQRGLTPEAEFPWSRLCAHHAVETAAYAATAIPQLLGGLDAAACAENAGKFGWLTHEEEPRCTALLCARAVDAMREVRAAGGFAQLLQSGGRPYWEMA